jgi:hypothetical protein
VLSMMEYNEGNDRGGSDGDRGGKHDSRINMIDQNKGIWRGRGGRSKQHTTY